MILYLIMAMCWWELCIGRYMVPDTTTYPTNDDISDAYRITSGIHNETARKILTQYLVFCPGQDMCHGNNLSRKYSFDFTPSCTPCECDDSCVRKSTCCPSKFLFDEVGNQRNEILQQNQFRKRPPLSCVRPFWNMHSEFHGKSYWLIGSCPNGESCDLSQIQARNISLSTPVTSFTTKESYKNFHCALCHNEHVSDLIFWKQNQVFCRKRSDLLTRKTREELFESVFSHDPSCNVLFYPPASIDEFIAPCIQVEQGPCSLRNTEEDRSYLIQACDKYYLPYSKCDHIFKNIFCALCEGVSLLESLSQLPLECRDNDFTRTNNILTFSALLDFDKDSEKSELKDDKCTGRQIYDSHTGKCLDLTCEKEYVLDQNPVECRPIYQKWGENNYELSMIFKLSHPVEVSNFYTLAQKLEKHLENSVEQNNLSEYLCVMQIFELGENNPNHLGALVGLSVNRRHDIDKMIEKILHDFQKNRGFSFTTALHGFDLNVSSLILGQRFHLDEDNLHFTSLNTHHYINPMTTRSIFPLYSMISQNQLSCSKLSSTIVVADWYRCPKVKLSTENTRTKLVNYSLCLVDYNECIPSRYFKKDTNNQQYEVCLDWYNRASKQISIQKASSEDVMNTYLSVICLSISSGGALSTILSYLVQKERVNSPGINIIILSLFLIFANTIYTVSIFFKASEAMCLVTGILIHFSWLSVVFWMSLSSFQIFQTFTNISVPTFNQKSNVLCFLLINSLLCLLLIGVNVTLSYSLSDGQSLGYSSRTCYIAEASMILYTFGLPVGLAVCINTFMFLVTVNRILWKGDMRKSKDQNRVGAFFRLSILTGMSWFFGFLAQFTDLQVFSVLHIVFSAGQGIFLYLGFGMPLGIKWRNARKSPEQRSTVTITESVN